MASMLFITPTLGACGDDGNDAPSQSSGNVVVSVAPEILSSGPESATLELTVTADADWAVKSDADWVSLRPSGGIKNESTIVKVTVQTNSGMEERTAAINIVSGGKAVKTVALTQSFVKKAISTASSFTFGAQESTGTFTVTSNADWTLESSENWLTVLPVKGGKGDTEVTVKAAANDGESTRNATLTLSCGETSSKMEVSQLSDEVVAPEATRWYGAMNSMRVASRERTGCMRIGRQDTSIMSFRLIPTKRSTASAPQR